VQSADAKKNIALSELQVASLQRFSLQGLRQGPAGALSVLGGEHNRLSVAALAAGLDYFRS
jgi:hypothetical protein